MSAAADSDVRKPAPCDSLPQMARKTVHIWELADENGVIDGKVIEDRHIVGPGVLALEGDSTFEEVSFGTVGYSGEPVLWEVDPTIRPIVVGVFILRNTTIRRCSTENIGVAGPPGFIQTMRQMIAAPPGAPPMPTQPNAGPGISGGGQSVNINLAGGSGHTVAVGSNVSTGSGQQLVSAVQTIESVAASGQPSLAEAMSAYVAAVAAAGLDEPAKEAQLQTLSDLGAEAAKPSPNQSRLKMLWSGLTTGARDVQTLTAAGSTLAKVLGLS